MKDDFGSSLMVILLLRSHCGRFNECGLEGECDEDNLLCEGGAGVVRLVSKPLRMRPAEKREERRDVDRRDGFVFLDLPM